MKKTKLWNNQILELKDNIFKKEILKNFINYFYETELKNIEESKHILFIFRIQLINNDIKTVTKQLKVNIGDNKNNLISYLMDAINLTSNNYNDTPIKSLIISYGIRKGKIDSTITNKEETVYHHVYYNHKLPIALNAKDYGDIIEENEDKTIVSLNKSIILVIKSNIVDKTNNIKYFKNGKLMYEWIDQIKEDGSLIREIGKSTIFWKDNEIVWTKILKKTKPIEKKKTSPTLNKKFLTMDIETFGVNIDNIKTLTPYLLCWYDGKRDKKHSYFIENGNIKNIIYQAMKDICIRKYKGYKIYLQNFSKFDAIFLIKYLVNIGDCQPIIHKDKIISFSFKPNWKKNWGSITFYDSYLLLPSSLKKLSESFNIENSKGIFPVLFNDINYQGEVPNIDYFNNISFLEYNNYKKQFNNNWNFKEESIKYCILFCKSLYQILSKFQSLIFKTLSININNYPTLPSLAFGIFRIHYLKKDTIHQISGDIDKNIRSGYTGGSTDIYIPKPPIGIKIHAYDVNSLYPFVLKSFKYPVGNPTYFEGDILKDNPNAFGFFYVKIVTPNDLKQPILQLHYNNRTVSPLGVFFGWFFSEELYNASKFGYSFEILRGYTFENDYIFKDYVDHLYNLRLTKPKTDPMNYIAKFLLNSLYGRFGMFDSFNIINNNK
jgi:hypothetical protein